jgi:DNA polymerase III epsilon subunit-like protein
VAILDVIRSGKFVVLDTETTGLRNAEICQIGVVSSYGAVLLDTLVQTKNPIPPEATAIHGITNEMVQDCITYPELCKILKPLLRNVNMIVYNAKFDRGMLHQSAEAWGMDKFDWKEHAHWFCAMEKFAEIYGDWNSYHSSYRWQTLATAARFYGIPVPENAHTAIADCMVTLQVCKAMVANDK